MRSAGVVFGLVGGIGQLALAFIGDAIGGTSGVVLLIAFDGIVAILGSLVMIKWAVPGIAIVLIAALVAIATIFVFTLLEIGVAALLLAAVAACAFGFRSKVIAPRS